MITLVNDPKNHEALKALYLLIAKRFPVAWFGVVTKEGYPSNAVSRSRLLGTILGNFPEEFFEDIRVNRHLLQAIHDEGIMYPSEKFTGQMITWYNFPYVAVLIVPGFLTENDRLQGVAALSGAVEGFLDIIAVFWNQHITIMRELAEDKHKRSK